MRLRLGGQAGGRYRSCTEGQQEEQGEDLEAGPAILSDLEQHASEQQRDEERRMAGRGASREEARSDAGRDQRRRPGGPGRPRRHAEAPVQRGRQVERPDLELTPERPQHERDEAGRLERRAEHDPASMRSKQSDRCGRYELKNGAREHRQGRDESRGNGSVSERQREGRQVGFTEPDHRAESDSVPNHRPQVGAQGSRGRRLGIPLRPTSAARRRVTHRSREGSRGRHVDGSSGGRRGRAARFF